MTGSEKAEELEKLEEYKKKVLDYLNKSYKASTAANKELIATYEDDLPTFLRDGWKPNEAGFAMVIGY